MENMARVTLQNVWKDRPVLVTGGAGFIGSWLARDLLQKGARVFVVDIKERMPFFDGEADRILENVQYIQGDVRDAELLASLYRDCEIETIFHLAAEAIVGEALKDPAKALDTNIRGTWQVLESFRKARGNEGQIVVASSDKAYGTHATLPYRETFALLGENPYDCSKSCADRIAHMYAKVYGVPVCITRCGNVFGGGDMNFSRLIPGAVRSYFFENQFEIRSDGMFRRDYIYIKDITAAYMRCAEAMITRNLSGEVFNFGNNAPLRVIDVVRHIAEEMGKSHLEPVILASAESAEFEIHDQYLDAAKAMEELGWRPQYDFAHGIRETIQWYTNFFSANATCSRV